MNDASQAFEQRIELDDSIAFARLSGDFNPLHVDPVYARRTRFGASVVHGIHLVLCALDTVLGDARHKGARPTALSCTFSQPVHTGSAVRFTTSGAGDGRVRVTGETEGRPAFALSITLGREPDALAIALDDREFDSAPPLQRLGQPPVDGGGRTALRLRTETLRRMFPALADGMHDDWIADLLATTRVVGMDCPGLHSIYGAFRLEGVESQGADAALRYSIQKSDPRFGLVKLGVSGAALKGTVEAFLRAPPVAQQSLDEVARSTSPNSYRGQRALVIGASRGLGELTAKILMAGGADVTITYARGRDDAARVCDEARLAGLACRAEYLDVSAPTRRATLQQLAAAGYTHVYFFASPHIARNVTGHWDAALFARLSAVYVDAFAELCQTFAARVSAGQPLHVFFPSTTFLDEAENGFAEYCAAKAAGEWLCDELVRRNGVMAIHPRLPRMRTDQTSGLTEAEAVDPFAVISALLPAFHSGRTV